MEGDTVLFGNESGGSKRRNGIFRWGSVIPGANDDWTLKDEGTVVVGVDDEDEEEEDTATDGLADWTVDVGRDNFRLILEESFFTNVPVVVEFIIVLLLLLLPLPSIIISLYFRNLLVGVDTTESSTVACDDNSSSLVFSDVFCRVSDSREAIFTMDISVFTVSTLLFSELLILLFVSVREFVTLVIARLLFRRATRCDDIEESVVALSLRPLPDTPGDARPLGAILLG